MMVGGTDPKGRDALKGEETLRRGTLKGGGGQPRGGIGTQMENEAAEHRKYNGVVRGGNERNVEDVGGERGALSLLCGGLNL